MKTFFTTFIAILLAVIVTGCATNKPLPKGLHTEAKSAGGIKVLSVGLLHDDAGLLVHGRVERMLGYADSPFRHLDVKVLGPAGQVLACRAINYFPNPIPFSRFGSGRSSYSVRVAEIPTAGSTILVAVDGGALAKCPLTQPATTY